MARVLLVNPPFASIGNPSLALGLLKSHLEVAEIPCDVYYLNIVFAQMVGWESYDAVERCSAALAGEQMFAMDLFGSRLPSDRQFEAVVLSRLEPRDQAHLRHMKMHVRSFVENCLERIPWHEYDVIGFSSMFEQNLAALDIAFRVKQRWPEKTIVFGGANCEDVMGVALHKAFSFVDFVCTGEADLTFPELVLRLERGDGVADLPGIVYRSGAESVHTGPPERVANLDELPIPDYTDYFRTLEQTGAPASLGREVVVETARGCWWGERAKCTFCGLNGHSMAFRTKSIDRAIEEISHLAETWEATFVRAVDNMMSPEYFNEFLTRLASVNTGFDLFYEVRPDLPRSQVEALARARVTNVQAGLENLSTHILKLMRKGTTALRNVEFLKWCKELGVYADWNMLFGFPGERREDYREAFELAQMITHLEPPACVGPVRLDRFSANFDNAEEIGMVNVRPWEMFSYIYPFDRETLMDLVFHFDFDYAERIDDNGYLARLNDHLLKWRSTRETLIAQRVDGALVVQDTRQVARAPEHRFRGADADVYEFCRTRRRTADIREWLGTKNGGGLSGDRLGALLDRFLSDKIMAEDKGWYLSLALMPDVSTDTESQPRGNG